MAKYHGTYIIVRILDSDAEEDTNLGGRSLKAGPVPRQHLVVQVEGQLVYRSKNGLWQRSHFRLPSKFPVLRKQELDALAPRPRARV